MTEAKEFQRHTVNAVVRAFRSGRRFRRFLVADEVGLGKTVVAQQVICELMQRRDEPLVVLYLCSNLSIASQNRRKLLEILGSDEERQQAICHVDRLPLLLPENRPTHARLNLYSLTPDTSIPMRKNRRRDGRQEERALIHALIERTFPSFFSEWGKSTFKRSSSTWWTWYLKQQRERARSGSLQRAFIDSLRTEFELKPNQQLLPAIRDLDELELIAHLRNALAASAIEQIKPDLVIFDEFQRFRDLLDPAEDPIRSRVVRQLRGEGSDDPPALLLLSATPYRPYARRWEEQAGNAHRREFFDLVEFLYGSTPDAKSKRRDCENSFDRLEASLRLGQPESLEALTARAEIEACLRPIMARTERASHPKGWRPSDGDQTKQIAAEIAPEDLSVFRHLGTSLHPNHRSAAIWYWSSIPLPMQTMGSHYVAINAANPVPADGTPQLKREMRDQFRMLAQWPHPRLRALQREFPPKRMLAPWIAPSQPWWDLGGPWRNEDDRPRKALVFSRFQAVPQAVAATVSYSLESAVLRGGRVPYADVTKRRALVAKESRHALVALFHPSPLLVQADPLGAKSRRFAEIRDSVRSEVREMLGKLAVAVSPATSSLPLWKLLARLEAKAGLSLITIPAWREIHRLSSRDGGEDTGLAELLQDWENEAASEISSIHPIDFAKLVDHALRGPGVVVGRALQRYWSKAVADDGFVHSIDAAWRGLRTYLDQRWFFAGLPKKSEKYPDAILRLVVEGNLEAVLDEHLWITSKLRSLSGSALAGELRECLSLRSATTSLHAADQRDEEFTLRCHVAMPFAQGRMAYTHEQPQKGERPIRTDDLRRSFNSPFWPFILATTSVGQEGLDFHAWCDTIVHWDLTRNPVDLEQREGRIQRFGGLSIRSAVVKQLESQGVLAPKFGGRTWKWLAEQANRKLADESGLEPWWVCEGGGVQRYVFDVPTSEQEHWLAWTQEQRLLYRLALGQPNQEDLVEVLKSKLGPDPEAVRKAMINLSPFFSDEAAKAPSE